MTGGPALFVLHGDAVALQMAPPGLEGRRRHRETHVAGPPTAVGGHRPTAGAGLGIEHQQHRPREAEEDVTAGPAGVDGEPQDAGVEALRRLQIAGVEDGLQHVGKGRG